MLLLLLLLKRIELCMTSTGNLLISLKIRNPESILFYYTSFYYFSTWLKEICKSLPDKNICMHVHIAYTKVKKQILMNSGK